MQLDLPRSRAGRGISLTPLIDVVFILLLFFLLASHFDQWRALRLDTTSANVSDRADDSQPPALLLRVHRDGRLDINGESLDSAQLVSSLEGYRARRPDVSVVIESDADVRLQHLVQVIDGVTAAGIEELSLK